MRGKRQCAKRAKFWLVSGNFRQYFGHSVKKKWGYLVKIRASLTEFCSIFCPIIKCRKISGGCSPPAPVSYAYDDKRPAPFTPSSRSFTKRTKIVPVSGALDQTIRLCRLILKTALLIQLPRPLFKENECKASTQ